MDYLSVTFFIVCYALLVSILYTILKKKNEEKKIKLILICLIIAFVLPVINGENFESFDLFTEQTEIIITIVISVIALIISMLKAPLEDKPIKTSAPVAASNKVRSWVSLAHFSFQGFIPWVRPL